MVQRNSVCFISITVVFALALLSCQKTVDDSNIAIDNVVNAAEVAEADIENVPPSETSALPETGPASSQPSTTIPRPFRGRWSLTPADCTSTRGDAKGLLTIEADRLVFYEARGKIGQVLATTTTSFEAKFEFSGEGQTWQRVERLRLVDGRLVRRTDPAAGQEPAVNLTYRRCRA